MSDTLLDERPVALLPSLVRAIGITEAAVLQQLHYWLQRASKSHDGHAWVYKTYGEWSLEIGVSAKGVRGALDRLRKAGTVVSMSNPMDARDRTLWWRIDHDCLPGSPSAPGGRPDAPGGSSRGRVPSPPSEAQGVLTGQPESTYREGARATTQRAVVPATKARRPRALAGHPVTEAEHDLCDAILAAFNTAAGTSYSAQEFREKILRRIREHPELDADAHRQIIQRNLAVPWWHGTADPRVVYGSDAQFERSMACDGRSGGNARRVDKHGLTPAEQDAELARIKAMQARLGIGDANRVG